ncbi:MAG: peptidase S41 [bacterium]|nr:peptidase S41 [bacterium]
MIPRGFRRSLFFSLLFSLLFSGNPLQAADEPLWMRYPAISPDGATIVFAYQGDLYRVDRGGGLAGALTISEAHDFMPVFSGDGQWIAFASDRYGNFDVFLMAARGGEAKRLTFHSADDFPTDFTPQGDGLLFTSARIDAAASVQFPSSYLPELYQVPAAGGRVRRILTTPADSARFLGDTTRIVYHDRKSLEDPWRKHHTSSFACDLRIYDAGSGKHRRLTSFAGEDRNPVPAANGEDLYYLSESSGSFNVHRLSLADPSASHQLTHFERHPVRFLTAARDDTLCFGFDGRIYTLTPGGEPRKVDVQIAADRGRRRRELLAIDGGATELALSPNGKEIAFVVRGEVFVASVEEGTTRRITDTPEQERSLSFRPDGRAILYAAERDQSWQLYATSLVREKEKYFFNATLLHEEAVLSSDAETFQPHYSPDGKEVAFLEERTILKVLNLESREIRTILPAEKSFSYADGDQYYQFSPDGRWFLVQYLQPGYWSPEVGLVRADGSGEVINATESGYGDFTPQWMMGGKMMIWFSDRDGLQGHAREGARQADVYAQFLTREAWDRFRLSKEEYALLKEAEEEAEEDGEEDGQETKKKDRKAGKGKGKKDEEAEEPEPIEIELEGLRDRRARLTIHSSRLSDAVVTPDGETLLYLTRFEKGHDLWRTNLRTRETKILAKLGARGGSLELDGEGKNVFLLAGGKISKIDVESGERKPIAFRGEMQLDRRAERAYFFEHVWRQVEDKFYDPERHGVDWDFYKAEYAKFLPHVGNDHDFAEMLSEMLGELNASHTGASYRRSRRDGDETASLGLFYDQTHSGPGLRIAEVIKGSPVRTSDSKIRAGILIEKIDGETLARDTNVDSLLNRKAGKNVLLSLYDEASGTRWEEVAQPISRRAERQLRYRRWVESRRRTTEELSDGRLGYVHVRDMDDRSYRSVFEEVMGLHVTREALVVDTRFNSGGDLVDDLANFLSGGKYMDFIPPSGRVVGIEPQTRWTRPSIVLADEGNYSDAHCFAWTYHELGLGKVVGMPVAGTCTFVWWERLHDRVIRFGIPMMAVAGNDGTPLENLQLEPDIRVANEYDAVAAGRDQQLERAVEELLRELDGR